MLSSSSGSDANSRQSRGPLCNCGRATSIVTAWTNENPSRRFFRCAVHGLLNWVDEDKPHGWQKVRLLEARDEIKALKESLKIMNEQIRIGSTTFSTDLVKKHEEEKMKLEIEVMRANEENKKLGNEVMRANEREKLLRQFVVMSWGGFIVVIAMILVMGKK
ncbi:uncharacterized protein At4g04775-like [Capsella rubella]|uniref:uncharacterized protein At4g04775-like n=1 Tax=Capsella rubella TaxID=81985 RepID=UPI000CD557A2|nr:uncharacterized protein At4g04775-like [Capsella rubella]